MTRFPLWLGFSLLAHGALLALLRIDESSVRGEGNRSFQVVLRGGSHHAAEPAASQPRIAAAQSARSASQKQRLIEANTKQEAISALSPSAAVAVKSRPITTEGALPRTETLKAAPQAISPLPNRPEREARPVVVNQSLASATNGAIGIDGTAATSEQDRHSTSDKLQRTPAVTAMSPRLEAEAKAHHPDESSTETATPAGYAASKPSSTQSIGRLLLESLHEHFQYPLRARRKGWQGDVLLEVSLAASGDITAIRILNGSGYSSLDRAAIESMQAVERIPTTVAMAGSYEIPVRYRLVN